MHQKNAIATVAVLATVVAFWACADMANAASGDAIHPGTLVKIYAVGPSQWVRRSATHSTSPVRAADNISKAQATTFLFEGGPTSAPIPLPSGGLHLVDAFSTRPYCDPLYGVSGWFDTTVMCRETSDGPWLSLVATSTAGNTVVNDGDEVYIFNGLNHQWCKAPTWPTNNAGIYCDAGGVTGGDNSMLRFRIYLA